MRLYSGSSQQFITDTIQNQISEKLKNAFFEYFHHNPSPNEINSWQNSLKAIKDIFQLGNLFDHGVLLEYQLPLSSKRLDCLICGKNENDRENAIIIELKQWSKCEISDADNEVTTWVGGGLRDVLHPSAQVGGYKEYLSDTHTAFYETTEPVILDACSYLHNYHYDEHDVIFAAKFSELLAKYPLFTADDVTPLAEFLSSKLQNGDGLDVLEKIEQSKYRPNKKLMDHISKVIKNQSEFVLLDEQKIVYDKVMAMARAGFTDKQKNVMIIKGGPGTGKSLIAINLMADLLEKGFNAHYATGSKAFTETLRKIIGLRGAVQFKYFNSYANADINDVDVLICDEAHRIRITSNSRFTKAKDRSNLPQLEELIAASKLLVVFIDDDQIVRPNEIGSTSYIKDLASHNNCRVNEFELETQFRCNGSDAFVGWVNNTLNIKKTPHVIWDIHEEFDFEIFDDPFALEDAIRGKVSSGTTGRMTAGFCWPWSNPDNTGNLVDDVVIGPYKRPWNAKPDAGRLAPGIPKSNLWAYDQNGIDQIGCIYTAQGFEFDYVGVIIGNDLHYNFDEQKWEAVKGCSFDNVVKRSGEQFIDLVKNTYRVLLTRGMKGCYVHFLDKDTERFFKSRIESK